MTEIDGYCWVCDETYFDGLHDWDKHKLYLKRIRERTQKLGELK